LSIIISSKGLKQNKTCDKPMDSENEDQSGVILSGFARTLIGVLFQYDFCPISFPKNVSSCV